MMKRLYGLLVFMYAIGFAQKSDIQSTITFNDDHVLNAKIPFITNLFDGNQIDEITLADKNIKILEDGKKIKYSAAEIKKIEFTDLKNKPRVFVYFPAESSKTLVEELYNGNKIKWFRSYHRHGFDGSTLVTDVLYKGNVRQAMSILINNRKKIKALMADKPALEPLIENINYNKLREEDLIDVLKKYDE
ncbi:hypothetical protein [Chryseobacterium sp. W4I1]|uniref:hypothetical protein n=1 Tax=Chryseobacterium sp. W4I1 TaxID=3042293 RepID=UPI0027864E6E|nr:hypothetical protein [Chryseobacterium sp. W4I1]MDQ0782836.1 hypothetical protein [Chryseobacterium sp. W4I1]